MLWIGLYLPQLALESFAATLGPAQAGQPLALLHQHRLCMVDAAAAALGLQPGMKRATALALAPALVLGQADAQRDAQALAAVAHAALAFTPCVALDAAGLRLQVQASLRYFGGAARLLARLGQALQPLGHQLQLASAPTALGASLLARWRADLASGAHSQDRTALRRLLDDAPLHLLPAGLAHDQALQGMGLRTLGDVQRLPRAGLARRFGPQLLLQLDQARGDAPNPQDWLELPARFDSRLELFARADTSAQVLAGAQVLLARLVAWARARQARIAGFTLRMHHEPRHRTTAAQPAFTELDLALAEPSADAVHLQLLLAERLGRLPLAAPALELSLHCDAAPAGAPPNAELFASRGSEQAGLTRLLERLQARLGPEQVRCLALHADHRPDRAAATQALPAPGASRSAGTEHGLPAGAAALRPLWLWPQARPLRETAHSPWLDGLPLQLVAGPERLETGWWDGALAARDYFIAQTPDGALVWIYRARLPLTSTEGQGWFLHGRFG